MVVDELVDAGKLEHGVSVQLGNAGKQRVQVSDGRQSKRGGEGGGRKRGGEGRGRVVKWRNRRRGKERIGILRRESIV